MELRFSQDTKHRKEWFTGISFSHPAKLSLPLQLWIIENYSEPGDILLDPMAGSGTILVACSLGRNVIACELEQKFVAMANANWKKIKQRGPQLGYQMGICQIIQGDARQLTSILCNVKQSDVVITSPPFADTKTYQDFDFMKNTAQDQRERLAKGITKGHNASVEARQRAFQKAREGSIEDPANIGNLESDTYLQAMAQVYQQCYKVLKPQGLMILVVKSFIREQKIVDLAADTIRLCEDAGFSYQERWYRALPSQSFWRIIYKRRYPTAPTLNFEDILVFVKGSERG